MHHILSHDQYRDGKLLLFAPEKRNILKADVHFQEKSSSASIIEPSDVSSAKLGLPNGAPQCETCGAQTVRECDGE